MRGHHARSRAALQGFVSTPPGPVSRRGHLSLMTIPFLSCSFYTHETHGRVYTNKPRALLMQQALYNEPESPPSLGGRGVCLQTLGGFHLKKKKTSSPFYHSSWICTYPNHPSPLLNRQCTQVPLTKAGQPLWQTVTMSVLHYSWTKA